MNKGEGKGKVRIKKKKEEEEEKKRHLEIFQAQQSSALLGLESRTDGDGEAEHVLWAWKEARLLSLVRKTQGSLGSPNSVLDSLERVPGRTQLVPETSTGPTETGRGARARISFCLGRAGKQ